MSRSNVVQRLDLAVARAAIQTPSLLKKRVSPHTLRHTTAMHLLQSGVPFNVNEGQPVGFTGDPPVERID